MKRKKAWTTQTGSSSSKERETKSNGVGKPDGIRGDRKEKAPVSRTVKKRHGPVGEANPSQKEKGDSRRTKESGHLGDVITWVSGKKKKKKRKKNNKGGG